jgi:hypothetical protein
MMTRIQLAQALCELSGVRDLVEDYEEGDFSDKTGIITPASYWINAGIRLLDHRWALSGTKKRTSVSLEQGQVYFEVPGVEFIERIETFDSDGVRHVLRQIPHDELRNMYEDELEDVDGDIPSYWCRAYGQRANIEISNGDFSKGLNYWTVHSGSPSVSSDVLSLDYSVSAPNDIIYQRIEGEVEGGIDVTVTVDSLTSGTLVVGVGRWNTEYFDITTVTSLTISSAGTFSFTPTGAWDVISLGVLAATNATAEISNVSLVNAETETPTFTKPWFIAMPPADQSYTLTVFGNFGQELTTDNAVNWWSINKPDWVIEAARAKLELDRHRNVSGMTAFLGHIEAELERMVAQDRFSYISGLTPKEACIDG